MKYLLEKDQNLGQKYQIVGAFTDNKNAQGISLVKGVGIELEVLDIHDYFDARNAKLNNQEIRKEYFVEVSRRIGRFKADLLMLSGFMRIITEPILSEYHNRILNVHPANLSILDEEGRRKYIGMDAVAKAIASGEKETRSTIHLVTADLDGGPIVVLSDPLPIKPGVQPEEHQEQMKWVCDGPAYAKALALTVEDITLLDRI